MTTIKNLSAFERQYLETALWASTDDECRPLDQNYTIRDIAPGSLADMRDECRTFRAEMEKVLGGLPLHHTDWERAAHDFWCSRNRTGAGFDDGDYDDIPIEGLGERLHELAKSFGERYLIVGDDGQIHQG